MTLAPAATEVVSKPAEWTGFARSGLEGHTPRPRRWLEEIRNRGGDVLYTYRGGTTTRNVWLPAEAYFLGLEAAQSALREAYRGIDLVTRTATGALILELKVGRIESGVANEAEAAAPLPESALIAKEVRELSGLSAERLGDIFPVERESYQRWISGKITPSSANLERLLALRHFLRELANRVEDPRNWLLAPLSAGASSATPYEALKAGNLTVLWDALADHPTTATRYTRQTPDGNILTVTDGSLRGRDIRTPAEELDDYDEWVSEDE